MDETELRTFAESQYGLLHRSQVLGVLTPRGLDHRVEIGTFERVRRNVYRIAGTPRTWHQDVMAACMSAGDGAAASHLTAARLEHLKLRHDELIDISMPDVRRVRLPGVRVHNTTAIGAHHVTVVDGIPVTSVARTLCDLTWTLSPWVLGRAVDRALTKNLVTLQELADVFMDLATKGRRRSTVMREILETRGIAAERADSVKEVDVIRVLAKAGLPAPTQQYPVSVGRRQYFIDVCYPDTRVAIEYDGWDTHRTRSSFDNDRARQNDLVASGWTILRFTSKSTEREIASAVRTVLRRAS